MGLSGIQILKLLPRTNCGECGVPTCLAFAMSLAAGKAELSKCPYVTEEAKNALSEASAPPIRTVHLGAGGNRPAVGGETVLFRHEKTFVNKTGLGVLVDEKMSAEDVQGRLDRYNKARIERVGLTLRPELVAIRAGSKDKLMALADLVAEKTDAAMVLMCADKAALTEVATKHKERKPLIHAATAETVDDLAALAGKLETPLVVKAAGLDAVAELAKRATEKGAKDLVLDMTPGSIKEAFAQNVHARRAAILKKVREVGHPIINLTFEMTDDLCMETMYAALLIAKYSSAVVLSDIPGHSLFPLLLERLNIYTDPQRPMKTEEKIYPINNPGPDSPVIVTCNFSLTYFIISGEVETSRVPAWLFVKDSDGLSVLTAWAAGKFSGDDIGMALKKTGIQEKVAKPKVIIPGLTAVISGDLEEELGSGWEVLIGPREGSALPAYLRQNFGQ